MQGSLPITQTREGKKRNGMEDKWCRPRTDTDALSGFNRLERVRGWKSQFKLLCELDFRF